MARIALSRLLVGQEEEDAEVGTGAEVLTPWLGRRKPSSPC